MAHSTGGVGDARVLERDLRVIFGARLQSLSTYAGGAHALAIVDTLTTADLRACAARAGAWHDAHLATPLLLAAHEFESALDAFPLEFGAILADHTVVAGKPPFDGLTVDPADVRRAIEVQARSQLIHLREAFVETRGDANALALLITDSAPAFKALLESVRRFDPSFAPGTHAKEIAALAGAHELPAADAERIFTGYLEAIERLVTHVDTWTA
ncbi:MAG TPA: hypothetical protein VFA27_01190 [Vicinamibacterales bacterium]|nr:hypothetical protein [Vicinamibacterales bacterium]